MTTWHSVRFNKNQLPAKSIDAGVLVKPANHCNNGNFESILEHHMFSERFNEWMCFVNGSYYLESTLVKA